MIIYVFMYLFFLLKTDGLSERCRESETDICWMNPKRAQYKVLSSWLYAANRAIANLNNTETIVNIGSPVKVVCEQNTRVLILSSM